MNTILQNFNDVFSTIKYNDDFGWSSDWNEEIEKWLVFAKTLDKTWYDAGKGRVKKAKQRDELLGELKAMYFIGVMSSCQITQIEPNGQIKSKNDFLFTDKKGDDWFVEVKTPSWRGEVSKEIDNEYLNKLQEKIVIVDSSQWPKSKAEINCPKCSGVLKLDLVSLDRDEIEQTLKRTICQSCKQNIWYYSEKERSKLKAQRLSQPQFINGEGRSFSDTDAVEDAIKNSILQFKEGRNNLLIVTHNMFAGPGVGLLSSMDGGSSIRKVIIKYDVNNFISCVCLLDVQLSGNGFKYTPVFIPLKRQPLI